MSKHWKCRIWKALWGLGALSLILAWVSVGIRGTVLGLDPLAWYWNALVLVVLSIPIKLDCHSCEVCMPTAKQ